VKAAAFQLRRSFDTLGLESFALLSGGKGIHVVVPLVPEAEWEEVREFAKAFCTALAEADPARFTTALPKTQRRERIFLDFLRNQRTATAIMPYSARARAGMPVATPVNWDELDEMEVSDAFSIADVKRLLKRAKDRRIKHWGAAGQRLPRLG
jgi:bifunctional non-homologous end joining protein LigD